MIRVYYIDQQVRLCENGNVKVAISKISISSHLAAPMVMSGYCSVFVGRLKVQCEGFSGEAADVKLFPLCQAYKPSSDDDSQ